jgi:hypothetical protein
MVIQQIWLHEIWDLKPFISHMIYFGNHKIKCYDVHKRVKTRCTS